MSTISSGRFAAKAGNTFLGMALLTACLTALFLSMRTVMDVGGSCADGGPYVSAQPCPDGIWLTPVSIFLGVAALGWLAVWNRGLPGPKVVLFAWPALFLSLGWNFWEYGLDPPGQRGGVETGWIVCGVLFVAMGGLPLLALLSKSARRAAFWSDPSWRVHPAPAPRPQPRSVVSAVAELTARARPSDAQSGPSPYRSRVVVELARLAEMHRDGTLTDEEFAAAKRQVLEGP